MIILSILNHCQICNIDLKGYSIWINFAIKGGHESALVNAGLGQRSHDPVPDWAEKWSKIGLVLFFIPQCLWGCRAMLSRKNSRLTWNILEEKSKKLSFLEF